jgi:hypothetical protein
MHMAPTIPGAGCSRALRSGVRSSYGHAQLPRGAANGRAAAVLQEEAALAAHDAERAPAATAAYTATAVRARDHNQVMREGAYEAPLVQQQVGRISACLLCVHSTQIPHSMRTRAQMITLAVVCNPVPAAGW